VRRLSISVLPDPLAVCRLSPTAAVPDWVSGGFASITRTADELSIVCREETVPDGTATERGWRAFKVEGPIPFEWTGIAASLLAPLAEAEISVFVISTFDTDYLLVKAETLERAAETLRTAGHDVF
jgi:hypothetical protein